MRQRLFAAVLLLAAMAAAEGYHRHFHVHQTGLDSAVITCDNGIAQAKQVTEGVEITCKAR